MVNRTAGIEDDNAHLDVAPHLLVDEGRAPRLAVDDRRVPLSPRCRLKPKPGTHVRVGDKAEL